MARLSVCTDSDRVQDLQCRIEVLRSGIHEVEALMERMKVDNNLGVGEERRDTARKIRIEEARSPDATLSRQRTLLYLLEHKLELVREKISASRGVQKPSSWNPERDYAAEFDHWRDVTGAEANFEVGETFHRKLSRLSRIAPETCPVTVETMATLKRVFDTSRELALLPDLGADAMKSLVKKFKENFLTLVPRGAVRVVNEVRIG